MIWPKRGGGDYQILLREALGLGPALEGVTLTEKGTGRRSETTEIEVEVGEGTMTIDVISMGGGMMIETTHLVGQNQGIDQVWALEERCVHLYLSFCQLTPSPHSNPHPTDPHTRHLPHLSQHDCVRHLPVGLFLLVRARARHHLGWVAVIPTDPTETDRAYHRGIQVGWEVRSGILGRLLQNRCRAMLYVTFLTEW